MPQNKVTEFCLVEMSREFYEANSELLSPPNAKLKSAYLIGESHKGDEVYEEKFEKLIEAQTELREYQYLKRYRTIIKID